ncbi:LLM class flavin-dependent oxidoreductase [Mycobacterium malmoense]|uniref:Monooxygenase n=1 Tax=Mycobacterium malmoense TaxID=1780 RepID=A0ABX3SSH6_MYCMA|nr:LLM class flavin-dependent oxidoreductase [Mycobacterium malmoense]ORA82728.1 monooxygenase [Mycobacterium malmoense]QZA16270.1 LLM class flavin-dependent oxidoreductase [Mycobacterium malmoense]UNB93077.1 LLM class flavin-dependent oxidoreductase [Mycobacterium malmoense]
MEFGIFIPSARNGYIVSKSAPQYSPTYSHMREIMQTGERNGFSFGLSLSTWRGHGGPTRFWDDSLESVTQMAALARDTTTIRLIGSVHTLLVHPAHAAKMALTLDSISDGRFSLNIVPGGWHPYELEVLRIWPGDDYHHYRWEYAGEYCQVIRDLWEKGVTNFEGKYFQYNDLRLGPTQSHHMNLVCAGTSDDAIRFTTKYADYAFRLAWGGPDALRGIVDKFNAQMDEAGRTIKPYVALGVVVDDTDEKAEAKLQNYIENADMEAINYMLGGAAMDTGEGSTGALLASLDTKGAVQMSTDFITGSPESIARQLDEWAEIDVAGYMLVLTDYVEDIKRLGREVFPRMKNFTAPTVLAPV